MVSKLFVLLSGVCYVGIAFPGMQPQTAVTRKKTNRVLRLSFPVLRPQANAYRPELVDWSSVISGCRAACRYDKRLCNFYVRAAAHDSLSVSEGFGGADGSLLLTEDELRRSENAYDNFAHILSKNALALASRFNSSVADVIAVCGAVSTEFLGGPRIIKYDANEPFLVGRHDKDVPNPIHSLAPANLNTTGFALFAEKRNLTLEEMTALMGSHALLDEKGCKKQDGLLCNPKQTECTELAMYSWTNSYYRETCTPRVTVNCPPVRSTLNLPTREFLVQQEMCKFTSSKLRQRALDNLAQEIIDPTGLNDPNALVGGPDFEYEDVTWADVAVRKWEYTVHDAWMGKACQGDLVESDYNVNIGKSMQAFRDSAEYWNTVYIRAYKKMVNIGAIWNRRGALPITGDECVSGYTSTNPDVDCRNCRPKRDSRRTLFDCPSCCTCKTAFSESQMYYTNAE